MPKKYHIANLTYKCGHMYKSRPKVVREDREISREYKIFKYCRNIDCNKELFSIILDDEELPNPIFECECDCEIYFLKIEV